MGKKILIPSKKQEERVRESLGFYKNEMSYLLARAAILGSLKGYKQGIRRSGKWSRK